MGKIFAALITFALVFVGAWQVEPVFYGADCDVTLYLGSKSSQCVIKTVSYQEYLRLSTKNTGVCGSSIERADARFVENCIKRLGAEKVFSETVGDTLTEYYYSTKISGYMLVNGKKVNIQTAVTNGNHTIGSPMIFGGY